MVFNNAAREICVVCVRIGVTKLSAILQQTSAASLHRRYVSGESYCYLGRQCRLKVVEDGVERVRLTCGYLTVSIADTNDKRRNAQ